MISQDEANELARSWIEAWNAHDLDAILEHYAEDVEFGSPFIAKRGFSHDGIINGTETLGDYFARGLEARPDLEFVIDAVLTGPDGVALSYHWASGDVLVVEVMQIREGKVVRARAHYDPEQIA